MVDNDILETLSSYAAAWLKGDRAEIYSHYHDDFTLHYPGSHALAGTHRGKPEALRVLQEVTLRTNRRLETVVDVMAGANRGALNVRERWRRDGEDAVVERVLVFTVRDGKLHQCWLFDADQAVVERFFGACA